MEKKNIKRKVFKLKERQFITPHFIRLTLGNDEVSDFKNTTVGVNNKIFIAPEGCDKVYLPEFDFEKGTWKPMDLSIKPTIRTYTHRGINLKKNELYIDFVAHGDEGPASDFALNAPIGAELGIAMGCDSTELFPQADTYLLVGDATAIPVLASILEALPASVKGHAVIEVETEEDIQNLTTLADIDFVWLINSTPGKNSELAQKVKHIVETKDNMLTKFAYIAAEFSTVKELRSYLRKDKRWEKDELYAYSYWKYGKAESVSEIDRRAEKDNDV
jgi:NADPH-dependent ferric siderophore reductase